MGKFCTNCGKEIPEGMAFCTECGTKVGTETVSTAATEAAATVTPRPADTQQKSDSRLQAQPVSAQPQPQSSYAQAKPVYTQPQVIYAHPASGEETEPKKDSKYAVMGTGSYLLASLLFAIPVVGWICCLFTAFTAKNVNRRNYARANLILLIIGLAISFMIYLAGKWVVDAILAYVNEAAAGMSGELGGIGEGLSNLGDLMDLLKQFQ